MSAWLEVIRPGMLTTVQDLGRFGYQRYGVPVSGAMDPLALQAANRLVGNDRAAAALELTIDGGSYRAHGDLVVALAGAPLAAEADGQPVPMWQAFPLADGQVLACGRAHGGARTVLAVRGAFAVPPVLGSASTYLKGGFGGLAGRALRAGDRLRVGPAAGPPPAWPTDRWPAAPVYPAEAVVRAVPGPEADAFSAESRAAFWGGRYRLGAASDRMGYRLEGPAVAGPGEILSDAVPLGCVQVPPDGQPIVMMADRQPTGGYARLAIVISVDLPRLAQLVPGQAVRFEPVGLAQARALFAEQEAWIAAIGAIP